LRTTLSVKESRHGCSFYIQVTPHASRSQLSGIQDGVLKIKVTALPVEGAANAACIKLLAKELGLKKSQIEIFAGQKSRKKAVTVKDITAADLQNKIDHVLRNKE
jgi:uncharacterized protein